MEIKEYESAEEIPSPEKLFHTQEPGGRWISFKANRRPIPRYKVVRRFSVRFILFLAVIIAVMLNLDKAGITYYNMESSSMESIIPKGSFLFVRKTRAENLNVDDIITFVNSDNVSVTHMIVEIVPDFKGKTGYRTRGIKNNQWDEDTVTYEDICGKVVFHIPFLGGWLSFLKKQFI